jgi:hypothetical protein
MRSNDPAEQRLTKWEKEIDAKQRLPNQGWDQNDNNEEIEGDDFRFFVGYTWKVLALD